MKASPGRVAPMPIAPTAASPPPARDHDSRATGRALRRSPACRPPTASLPSTSRGAQAGIDAAGRQRLERPGARLFVEPPRPRRVAHVGSDLAGQAEAQVVLGLNDVGDRGEDRRLMARQPDQLRRDEPGHRLDADDVGERAMALPQFGRLAIGARVVVEDRRPQRLAVAADQHRAVHLAGEADRAGRGEGVGRGAPEFAERREHRRDPDFRVLLRPQRPRMIGAVGARRRGDQPSLPASASTALRPDVPQSTPIAIIARLSRNSPATTSAATPRAPSG